MNYSQHTYYSRVYRDFRSIEPGAHRDVVHFYEAHETEIRNAEFEEYFEILVAYTEALFETGAYRKHLLMSDVAIGESMSQELEVVYGKLVFEHMIFRKAASHYNLAEFDEAQNLLGQLIRIDPEHEEARRFHRKCLYHRRPRWLYQARAAAIFLFLLAALVIFIELLFVRPFYNMHTHLVETSRNTIFAMGFMVLIAAEAWHLWMVWSFNPSAAPATSEGEA